MRIEPAATLAYVAAHKPEIPQRRSQARAYLWVISGGCPGEGCAQVVVLLLQPFEPGGLLGTGHPGSGLLGQRDVIEVMRASHVLRLATRDQLLEGILPYGVEERVPGWGQSVIRTEGGLAVGAESGELGTGVFRRGFLSEEAFVYEGGDCFEGCFRGVGVVCGVTDGNRGLDGTAADKYGQPPEKPLLVGCHQVVAPAYSGAQGLVAC